ncbi:MAG TPA: formate dehydrogenase subunit gamma [Burkholderiales bacterium]|nr:formate dehydrogenase subunit gamma [Burkholderiales bacterium]
MTDNPGRDSVVRYSAELRTNHWLNAIAFVLAALSGLALFHPALFWFGNLFGGGPWTRILHPFIGLAAALLFLLMARALWGDNRITPADRQWLKQWRDVVDNREDRLPEVGRYNAGQKLLFLVIVVGMAGLFLTGIVIWRAYFSAYFPIRLIRFSSLLHSLCAFALIVAVMIHIYASLWVKGSVHAMLRGTVTPGWAWKHHRAWYRQLTHDAHPRSGPN